MVRYTSCCTRIMHLCGSFSSSVKAVHSSWFTVRGSQFAFGEVRGRLMWACAMLAEDDERRCMLDFPRPKNWRLECG
jgi:hypothetical protein